MTEPSSVSPGGLTLQQCAGTLGVHYMTVYKYVRTGRLPATKVGSRWIVRHSDLARLHPPAGSPTGTHAAPWSERLEDRLLAGDRPGSWGVVESALASGLDPVRFYVDVLAPALRRIGDGWARGDFSVAEEHRASVVAGSLMGRLGPRFNRPGRKRGKVVIGTPPGEQHALAVGMAADLLRAAGWEVVDLGADLPVDEFVRAAKQAAPIDAVAVSVTASTSLGNARSLVSELRRAGVGPIVVGGGLVDAAVAAELGGDAWAGDAESGIATLEALLRE
ncbi:MAG: cobalamin-dependent protein [Acidimicrobiia bacterium]|nr:MAG: cobalamin-dependent protein [Acidimicrobiia bacterium]